MKPKPNGADVAALVVAILLPVIGLILGLVRRSQWKAGGMQSPTVTTLAIVLGAVLMVVYFAALMLGMAYVGYVVSRDM